ncbi:MAG: phosphoribosylglycinamide formyltransferase [Chitinophagales bacterium]|nr:phosphoribosylglycinamide formyltransferase [Chitinophagales bacterium]MCC7056497.1 phosphoribosylglycinamide formyltransferase [Chitinophagales bacterium]MDA0198120.1 phosphoribosylglycinamide formyltransferase [Bacteroidota bacterium]
MPAGKTPPTHLPAKIALLISGRGSNMVAILKATQPGGILYQIAEPVLVFSNNCEAKGLDIANEMGYNTVCLPEKAKNGIRIKRNEYDTQVSEILTNYHPELLVLAGYMRILSPQFIKNWQDKIVNIHPADTKLHQGLHGYNWAFENKLPHTCVTVHWVNEGVDTGTIIAQKKVNLQGAKSLFDVEQEGLKAEHELYPATIRKILLERLNP